MDKILRFTKAVEEFMIKNGFTADETMYYMKEWYDNPNDIVMTQDVDYWYYNFVINYADEEHLHHRFHSMIAFNESNIKKCIKHDGTVGCIACDRVYSAKEIVTFLALPREDNTKTVVCPYCECKTVVPNYIYGRKKYYDDFGGLINDAHHFWFVYGKFKLLDKTKFERFI
jgi:hypothetical protein